MADLVIVILLQNEGQSRGSVGEFVSCCEQTYFTCIIKGEAVTVVQEYEHLKIAFLKEAQKF